MKRSVALQICKLYERLTLIKNCQYKRLYLARKVFFVTNNNIRGVRYLDNKLSYMCDRINNYFSTSEVSKPIIEDTTNDANEIYDFYEIKNNLKSLHEFVNANIKCLNEDELDENDKESAEDSSEDESDEDDNATAEEFSEDESDEDDNATAEESTFFGFPKNSNEKWELISNELDRDSQFMFKFLLKCKTIIIELKKFIKIIYKIFFFANQLLYLWLTGKNDKDINYKNVDDNERIQNYRKRIRLTGKFKCDIRKLFKIMKTLSFSTETVELISKLNTSSTPSTAAELQTTPCTSPCGSTYSREAWIQKPRGLASGHVRRRRSEHVPGTSTREENVRSTLDVSVQISENSQCSGNEDVPSNVPEIIGESTTYPETSPYGNESTRLENWTAEESWTIADTNEKDRTIRTAKKRKIEDTDINATIRKEKVNKTGDLSDSCKRTFQLDSVERTCASDESSSTSPMDTRDKETERETPIVSSVNASTVPVIEAITTVSTANENFENDSTNHSVVSMASVQLEHETPLNEKVLANNDTNEDNGSYRRDLFEKKTIGVTNEENELDARETIEATNNLQQLYPSNLTKTSNVVQWTENGMLDPSLMLSEENFLENIYIDNDIYMDTSSRQYLKLPVFNERDEELNVIVKNAMDNVLEIAAIDASAKDAASIERSSSVSIESSKVDVSVRWFVRDSLKHVKLEPLFDSWNSLDNNSNICILTYQNLELYVIFNGVKSCLNRSILKQFKKCKLNDFHMIIATNLGKQIGKHILIIKHNLSCKNLNTVISILENAKKVVSFMKDINAESDDRLYESSEKSALIFYSKSNDCIIGFKNEYIRKFGVWGKLYRRDACYVKICCRGNEDRYINCGLVKISKMYDRIKNFVGEEIKLYGSIIVKFADFKNNIVVHAKLFIPKEDRNSQSVMYINKTDDICYIDDIAYNSQDYTNYIDGL